MAGKPIERKLLADIEAQGGWEAIWDRTRSRETQTAIAKSFGVSQGFLSRVIHLDPERTHAYREAKRDAADAFADAVVEVSENAGADRDAIAKAKLTADAYRWRAERQNREAWGEQKDVSVTVNLDSLYLEALKRVNRTQAITAHVTEDQHPALAAGNNEPESRADARTVGQ